MSSSASQDGSRETLSAYLEGLYALAQIVSSGPDEAADLVEQTFRRARQEGVSIAPADPGATDSVRVDLYRILLDVRARRPTASYHEPVGGSLPSDPEMSALRTRLAERFVDAALPASFATLGAEPRILLMLCDVQQMSCAEAARVLHLDAETACARLDEARDALSDALYASASPVERRLLESGLSGGWKQSALRRMTERELSAVPPTLHPALLEAAGTSSGPPARTDEEGKPQIKRIAMRAVAVLLIIAVAGVLGYGFSALTRRAPDVNLITLSAKQAGDTKVTFETTSAEQAERFVRDRLGRRITVPSIGEAALQGILIRDVADGAEAPVIVYSNGAGASSIVVYVYSYAFLDAHRQQVELPEDVLRQIETEGNFDLHDLGETRALVWRRRADIYVAVTDGDAEELRNRIRFPS